MAKQGEDGFVSTAETLHQAFQKLDAAGTGLVERRAFLLVLGAVFPFGLQEASALLQSSKAERQDGVAYEVFVDWLFPTDRLGSPASALAAEVLDGALVSHHLDPMEDDFSDAASLVHEEVDLEHPVQEEEAIMTAREWEEFQRAAATAVQHARQIRQSREVASTAEESQDWRDFQKAAAEAVEQARATRSARKPALATMDEETDWMEFQKAAADAVKMAKALRSEEAVKKCITSRQLVLALKNMATGWDLVPMEHKLPREERRSFFEEGPDVLLSDLIERWHSGRSAHPDREALASIYPCSQEGARKLMKDAWPHRDSTRVLDADLRYQEAKFASRGRHGSK
mmetsp:Transcript_104244/g.185227  ORF Transcript_104244/g.185227 Transcript_104244/m.185227 type:complete len:343 (+) Transcript_104244:68-1096(+)